METDDATNQGADEDLRASDDAGVADGADAQGELDTDLQHSDGEGGEGADDTEEIEFDGKKHRIPKALKGAFLMQADYTKKTQTVAERERAIQAKAAEVEQIAQAREAIFEDRARVHNLRSAIKSYDNVDWDALEDQDPDRCRKEERKLNRMKADLAAAESELKTKEDTHLQGQRDSLAKARQGVGAALADPITGIKDWGQETAAKLAETAGKTYGISVEELRDTVDPRIWKILNDAHQWHSHQAKQKAVQRQAQSQSTTPATTVSTRAAPTSALSDRAPTGDWMKARAAQVAKRA